MTCPEDHDSEVTWRYRSIGLFLQDFLCIAYARQVTDLSHTVWCPEPFKHLEAFERLGNMWLTYEQAQRSPNPREMNDWWHFCAQPHMARLFDPLGPFKHCSVRNGHKDMLQPLPVKLPPELFLEIGTPPSATPDTAA